MFFFSIVTYKSSWVKSFRGVAGRWPHLSIFGGPSPLPAPLTRHFHVGTVSVVAATLRSTQLVRSLRATTIAQRAGSKPTDRAIRDLRSRSLSPQNKFKYRYCLLFAKNRTYSMSTPTIDFSFHPDPGATHAVAFATKDQMVLQTDELVFISTFTLSLFTCNICVFPQFARKKYSNPSFPSVRNESFVIPFAYVLRS